MTTTKNIIEASKKVIEGQHGIIIDGVTIWEPQIVSVRVLAGTTPAGDEKIRVYTIRRTAKENKQEHSIWCTSYITDGRFKWNEKETFTFYADDSKLDAAIKRIEKMTIVVATA